MTCQESELMDITELKPTAVYTLQEAAEVLRLSEPTLTRWIKAGKLSGYRLGKKYRILGRDLLALFEHPIAEKPKKPE
jgi:excisionase family DNA binding protein